MRNLSKSKLMAYRQCPKRLWLEIHRPDLREDSAATQASFNTGHHVGDIARNLYDPEGKGAFIDLQAEGFRAALERSAKLIGSSLPIFEAGFAAGGALAFSDVMLPVQKNGSPGWKMVEVKSSTSVKDYHRDDTAVQAYVARTAGVQLESISLAHIDSSWVYPGGGDYRGLLKENDLTEDAFARDEEVRGWITDAQKIMGMSMEPKITTGGHCGDPFECGFIDYCRSQEPQAEYPVNWLPRVQAKALKDKIEFDEVIDLRDIPDDLLNESQLRVKKHTLAGTTYFDALGAAADLASYKAPYYFLDFETISFAVPIWKGTRPYQQIPFQFSVHKMTKSGKLEQRPFIDLSGDDPSEAFALALIDACGKNGTVFVYNAAFESSRINELAQRFPELESALRSINDRIVDLLPVAKNRYYHPSQKGSWSIKKVLPAIVPTLDYGDLDGVQDGGMAMDAFVKAIHPDTTAAEKSMIERQLLEYCALDTFAMVKMWEYFTNGKSS